MQQALDALSRSDYLSWRFIAPLIEALRERLAQPDDEPVGEVLNERGEVDYIRYVPEPGTPLYTHPQPAAQWQGLTDDTIYAAAEVAWRTGWEACRDAEYVGKEAEDEAWGEQGANVIQDIEAKLREKLRKNTGAKAR